MRRVLLVMLLVVSLFQGMSLDGRAVFRPRDLDATHRIQDPPSRVNTLSVPAGDAWFAREIATMRATPVVGPLAEAGVQPATATPAGLSGSNLDPERTSPNLHPREWGLIAPLFARADG